MSSNHRIIKKKKKRKGRMLKWFWFPHIDTYAIFLYRTIFLKGLMTTAHELTM
jgi:hypothetical protein